MNIFRFFDPEDAYQPKDDQIGRQGFELFRATSAGLQILPTLVIGTRAFKSYQAAGQVDDRVIVEILAFASETEAVEITIRPTSAEELTGLPGSEKTIIDRNHIRYLIERIYRSWGDPRTRVYRESQKVTESRTYPSVVIQIPRPSVALSLSTRNPRTGEVTSAVEFTYNVNNRIPEFKDEYETLMRTVEDVRGMPTQIDFQYDSGRIHIVGLDAQVMSDPATLRFVSDRYNSGLLKDADVLSIIKPRMLGSVWRESYKVISSKSRMFQGIAASPGVASGQIVWPGSPPERAASRTSILAINDLWPDDVPLLSQCVAAFSTRGGKTSHLAVASRGLGLPAVTGLEQLKLDIRNREIVSAGEVIPSNVAAIVGNSGLLCLGDGPELPGMRLIQEFRPSFPISIIDWIDDMAQSAVDNGVFSTLPIPLQSNIAALRQMVAKIRAGHD